MDQENMPQGQPAQEPVQPPAAPAPAAEPTPAAPAEAAPAPQAPQNAPQQQYVPSYADNAVKTQKGMNWAVTGVIVVIAAAIIGGAAWFFMQDGPGPRVSDDPDTLLLNAVGQLVTADDVQGAITVPAKTVMALGGASAEELTVGLEDVGLSAADMEIAIEFASVDNGTYQPDSDVSIGISSASAGIDLKFLVKTIGDKIFAQLATFVVPDAPMNFSPLAGKWIKVDFAELEAQFALGAGDAYEAPIDPTEYIEFDQGAYFDAFRSTYIKHKPFEFEVDNTKATEIVLYPEFTDGFKPFVMEVVPMGIDMMIVEINAALAEQEDEDVVAALEELKVEMEEARVSVLDDLGPALDDLLAEEDETAFSELDDAGLATDLLDDMELGLVINADTGEFKRIQVEFDTDEVALAPLVLEWTGINTGYTIAEPAESMTVSEAMPIVMGILFGGFAEMDFSETGSEDPGFQTDGNGDPLYPFYEGSVESGNNGFGVRPLDTSSDAEMPGLYPTSDTDGDGLLNVEEEAYGTDPNNPDTDGDGYTDYMELENGYDPLHNQLLDAG